MGQAPWPWACSALFRLNLRTIVLLLIFGLIALVDFKYICDMVRGLFQHQSQTDVIAVLMLLGEAVVWKAIWTRFRSQRTRWQHWVFAVSPGWAPLTATLFTALSNSNGPPNLVFDRPPEGTADAGLMLTNLNSGASHLATNTVLQNVWNAWKRGPRQVSQPQVQSQHYNVTREVGVVDLDLDKLVLDNKPVFWIQFACLVFQITCSFVLALVGWTPETLIVTIMGIIGQTLMLFAITPRPAAWNKAIRGHCGSAIMMHKGLDTTEVLIIRRTTLSGRQISLVEFVWETNLLKGTRDHIKLLAAAAAFVILALQIAVVGWMSNPSRISYLLLGGTGMLSNCLQAACQPDCSMAYYAAFRGRPRCAMYQSCLLGAVGLLLAGGFPAAEKAAQPLYPVNQRFMQSVTDLQELFRDILCQPCQEAIRAPLTSSHPTQCVRSTQNGRPSRNAHPCSSILASRIQTLSNKQYRDAFAAVSTFLAPTAATASPPAPDNNATQGLDPLYTWLPSV